MSAAKLSSPPMMPAPYLPVQAVNPANAKYRNMGYSHERKAAERGWNAPIASHVARRDLMQQNQTLAQYLKIENTHFLKMYNEFIRPHKGHITVMGLLGLGSPQKPWSTETHKYGQLEIFRMRHAAWLGQLTEAQRALTYTFACDPKFTHHSYSADVPVAVASNIAAKSDTEVLRHCGIAAFPFHFVPGQRGDHYGTHLISKDPSFSSDTTTIYFDLSCPVYLRKEGFLDALTLLDIAMTPWIVFFDLLLWSVLHKKLKKLIVLYADALGYFGAKGVQGQCEASHYTSEESTMVAQALVVASKDTSYPVPPLSDGMVPQISMWWEDAADKGLNSMSDVYWRTHAKTARPDQWSSEYRRARFEAAKNSSEAMLHSAQH